MQRLEICLTNGHLLELKITTTNRNGGITEVDKIVSHAGYFRPTSSIIGLQLSSTIMWIM